jgi:hypothetical protein
VETAKWCGMRARCNAGGSLHGAGHHRMIAVAA